MTPEDQYNENYAYFKEHHPYLSEVIRKTKITKYTLDINSQGQVDFYSGNSNLYGGDARSYSVDEVKSYLKLAEVGKPIKGLEPHPMDAFKLNRFFSKSITTLYESIDYPKEPAYKIPSFYPIFVIIGVGAGFHIEEIIENSEILSLIIHETEPEEFILSLYTINWKKIFDKFRSKGKSIQIIIEDAKDSQSQFAILWNVLIDHAPSFSLATFLYNHRNQYKNKKIIKRIKENLKVYLTLWGYYDDEINQFNNGLHNLYSGHSLLPKQDSILRDVPIFIVGSGPSLDLRIEDIKSNRDKVILISSGTALRSLYMYGIQPDIHVEIESDYEPYKVISELNDQAYLDDIILFGAVQLNPKLLTLFKKKILFIKDSTSLFGLASEVTDKCKGTTPTCTNTSFAFSSYFNFKNIFLFGTDYGFQNNETHHSKHSIYYSNTQSDVIAQSNITRSEEVKYDIKSVTGEDMLTTPIYNSSRARLETDFIGARSRYDVKLYNCSHGAEIKNATFLPELNLDSIVDIKHSKKEFIDSLNKITNSLSNAKVSENLNIMENDLLSITKKINSYISDETDKTLINHFKKTHIIGQFLAYGLNEYGPASSIIKGSIWHYLHAGASIALKMQDNPSGLIHFITTWEDNFKRFLEDVPKHFHIVTSKNFNKDDPWVNNSIWDNLFEDFL